MRSLSRIGLAIAFAGCASRGAGPARAPADAPAPPSRPQASVAAVVGPQVTLIDKGNAPHEPLTHAPTAGRTEAILVELGGALTLAVGDMSPAEMRTPLLRVVLSLQAGDPEAGRISLSGKVEKVDVIAATEPAPSFVAAVHADLEPLRGARFTAFTAPNGITSDVTFAMPDSANLQLANARDRLREAIERLLPALPDGPVGKGARWEVRRPRALGAARMIETTHYSMTERSAKRARLSVKITQRAEPQILDLPGLPAATTVTLTSLSATGGGKVEARLGELTHPTDLRWTSLGNGTAMSPEGPAEVKLHAVSTMALRRARP